jgi:hypothetical protein
MSFLLSRILLISFSTKFKNSLLLSRKLISTPSVSLSRHFESIIECKTSEDMERLGSIVSKRSHCGDIFLLRGYVWCDLCILRQYLISFLMCRNLAAGKTCFSRGFIRDKLKDPNLYVTSPSYLLDNVYTIDNTSAISNSNEK